MLLELFSLSFGNLGNSTAELPLYIMFQNYFQLQSEKLIEFSLYPRSYKIDLLCPSFALFALAANQLLNEMSTQACLYTSCTFLCSFLRTVQMETLYLIAKLQSKPCITEAGVPRKTTS